MHPSNEDKDMELPTTRSAANTNIGANKIEKSEVDCKSQKQVSKAPGSKVSIRYFIR